MADHTGPVLPDPSRVPRHQWYVSPTGIDTNEGTIGSPWSLSYASGGAEGRIVPGDTVWVRGGTYRSQTGFTLTVSGTATDKVTFKQSPGETVSFDGALAEFTTPGNTAWEPYGTQSPGHNVYRSVQTFPVTAFIYYGGFIPIDDAWYALAPHKSEAYLLSDTHGWDYPHPRYLGPGIAQNTTVGSPDYGHLFIRLDNSTAEAQLGRAVTQIHDPDPRHHALYVCSSRYFGFTLTGSHLVLEDFTQIYDFGGCFYMGTDGQTDVTIRNCGGRPVFFGARCGYVDGLTLDSCHFYAHMPSHTWWVAWQDIQGGEQPAGHVRKVGLDLGVATHVEVVNCLFEEFFYAILASGIPPARAPHDIEIHYTTFKHIWGDAWRMNGNLSHINFHHNVCYGAGPSLDASYTSQANTDPGTVYIHHNVIDTTTRLVFWGRYGRDDAGVREAIPLATHGSPTAYTWPRKFYYNTLVTGQTVGAAVYVGWGLFGLTATTSEATHEVYNNIFHVMDGRAAGRDFNATTGREIYDGNVYWHYQVGSPSGYRSPWRLLHMSTGMNGGTFTTVSQLRASQAFLDSQAYYTPGWENSGLSVDPQLDRTYAPQNASCQRGAVNLTTTGWPGTASYEAWRGAMHPAGALMAEYTVTDLGTLGGRDSFAAGVNEFRQAVGVRLMPDAPQRAILYSDGTLIDLGTLGGRDSYAAGVNASGQVVGESTTLGNATHAFLSSGGTMTDLGTLGGRDSFAAAINTAGQVVGVSDTPDNGTRHAFLSSGGTMTDLGTLGGRDSFAYGINTAGQVVGVSDTPDNGTRHAFLSSGGTMTDLGTLGGRDSFAAAINAAGQVVGDAATPDNATHAFLYTGGTMTDLGTLGGTHSFAAAINDAGQVVGNADIAGNGIPHAFLYSDGTMTDLNDLAPARFTVMYATGINAAGQILGVGRVGGSTEEHALLLTPTFLNRFAYANYTPDSQYTYNASGGAISITRQDTGLYEVVFDSLPAWGPGLSSAVAVTAYGSSPITCSVVAYRSSLSRTVVHVACFDVVTQGMADSPFTIMVVGNQSLPVHLAFVMSGGPAPASDPASSWTSIPGRSPIVTREAPGDYSVRLGTGNTPQSAKLVTGITDIRDVGIRCNAAGPISGGLQVRCYDRSGAATDQRFSVVQVTGGRPGRRIGFALANEPRIPSYTPNVSFNSAGGAITATHASVGHYAMHFAGLQNLLDRTEHVQVTASSDTLATCNVVSWDSSADGLTVFVECRDGAGQFMDARYYVLVIE